MRGYLQENIIKPSHVLKSLNFFDCSKEQIEEVKKYLYHDLNFKKLKQELLVINYYITYCNKKEIKPFKSLEVSLISNKSLQYALIDLAEDRTINKEFVIDCVKNLCKSSYNIKQLFSGIENRLFKKDCYTLLELHTFLDNERFCWGMSRTFEAKEISNILIESLKQMLK